LPAGRSDDDNGSYCTPTTPACQQEAEQAKGNEERTGAQHSLELWKDVQIHTFSGAA
jgi:hypothetical protein